MIFVTLGSQKFQFDRLLKKIDELIDKGIITDEVYDQIGASTYIPRNYNYTRFVTREEFADRIENASLIVTHGGTGVIMGAVKKGKKVIAVPRLAKYGEHVDDHQLQLLHQFDDLGIICSCYDVEKLDESILEVQNKIYKPYVSNTQEIIDSIEEFLNETDKNC
jgi:UDP-N-acetylglucosamine transferase subunit ALG13